MLEYGEYKKYKELMNILETKDEQNMYQDLMDKEKAVLGSVNGIINSIRDRNQEEKQFIHMSLYEITILIFTEIPKMMQELLLLDSLEGVPDLLTKNHRILIISVLMILISLFLFFIQVNTGK
jgi:hypothetical protein